MDIQETGLAYVIPRSELRGLAAELTAVFGAHGDWTQYEERPNLPLLSRLFNDLYRRGLNTGYQSHTGRDLGYTTGELPAVPGDGSADSWPRGSDM